MSWDPGLTEEIEATFASLPVFDVWGGGFTTVQGADASNEGKRSRRLHDIGVNRRRKLAVHARILELRADGVLVRDIADIVGRSRSNVQRVIRRHERGEPTLPRYSGRSERYRFTGPS